MAVMVEAMAVVMVADITIDEDVAVITLRDPLPKPLAWQKSSIQSFVFRLREHA